jgi:hypothetical protein
MSSLLAVSIVIATLAASACRSDRDTRKGAPQPTAQPSTTAGSATDAVEAITAARCERELRCRNIGPEEGYVSVAACESEIRSEWQDELNATACGAGVAQKQLDECLEEVRNEDCVNAIDTLERLGACRSNDLCKESPTARASPSP